ncbi:hypothetical protein AB7M15_000905 [Bradyrhizobium ottawaense]
MPRHALELLEREPVPFFRNLIEELQEKGTQPSQELLIQAHERSPYTACRFPAHFTPLLMARLALKEVCNERHRDQYRRRCLPLPRRSEHPPSSSRKSPVRVLDIILSLAHDTRPRLVKTRCGRNLGILSLQGQRYTSLNHEFMILAELTLAVYCLSRAKHEAISRDSAQTARRWRGAVSEGSPIANHGAEVRSSAGGIAVRRPWREHSNNGASRPPVCRYPSL